ncbi:MAG: hypothetical protein KDB07_03500 [Planctomycetes bacterium]|nr:hypothetical protein [Planctomycetota bacterium]
MNKTLAIAAALAFGLTMTLGACKDDHDHDHDHGDDKTTTDHGHDHGKTTGGASTKTDDGHEHMHEHGDGGHVLGKATINGVEVEVTQLKDLTSGDLIDFKFVVKGDGALRAWFGDAGGKLSEGSAPDKPHAHNKEVGQYCHLRGPKSFDGVKLWVEVETGEGESKKTEKKSFELDRD